MQSTDSLSLPAVEQLYRHHHGWLQGWLHRKLGDSGDAADLAQDTFVRLMAARRPPVLREEPRALITHIAKGLLVDHWRRRAVQQAYLDAIAHLPEPQVPSPETGLMIVQTLVAIDAMLQRLPAATREMFLLAQLDGLTLQEISQQTGKPVITVRRHLRKALMACMTAAA
ncbi:MULTISPECIES: sigma-70 family RNA polymerase sigma factor [Achromobacter]|uniref:Putative RNA polymerase sigma factor FecI n=1 Tax=Achromobacter animicus TaxID=1389935 RepID=A0A6S6ZNB4_9BURK|nr:MULTISPECIES: sigma-70 family RNA polymerase sigma factor [Achromobacter]MBV7499871.1 sigma-70 family RNA polymerase sigma factor [Achromobacter sp. ACM05]CAB3682710.1 putative RNA polymerase sigma factor FecI [Achromobacter animicus]HAP26304.1 RNA polymerase subunit sigma [Achromobacter sp.]